MYFYCCVVLQNIYFTQTKKKRERKGTRKKESFKNRYIHQGDKATL